MVQRHLLVPPQELDIPGLQPKRTNAYDVIEHGRLEKELPALSRRGQGAIVDIAGLHDSQREPNVSAPNAHGRTRKAADGSCGTQGTSCSAASAPSSPSATVDPEVDHVSIERLFSDSLAAGIRPFQPRHVDEDEDDDWTGMVVVRRTTTLTP